MERLIDATRIEQYILNNCSDNEEINAIYAEIINAPTVDAVEIVRCKDCIHCADDWNGNQPQFTCELGRCGESVYPSDFCSYGERREDETN